jgi:hypothetical protein
MHAFTGVLTSLWKRQAGGISPTSSLSLSTRMTRIETDSVGFCIIGGKGWVEECILMDGMIEAVRNALVFLFLVVGGGLCVALLN